MTRLIAFDIDGVMTTEDGREIYQLMRDSSDMVGIVSGRSEEEIESFLEEHGLLADFQRSANIKARTLRKLRKEITAADEHIYYGSWARDIVAARVARWEPRMV